MADYGSYGGYGSQPTGVADQAAQTISLVFIILSFLMVAYLTYRVKTTRSFQFQMFVFALILLIGEGPVILDSLGIGGGVAMGLVASVIHAASMTFLSGFIAFRVLRYFRQGKRQR